MTHHDEDDKKSGLVHKSLYRQVVRKLKAARAEADMWKDAHDALCDAASHVVKRWNQIHSHALFGAVVKLREALGLSDLGGYIKVEDDLETIHEGYTRLRKERNEWKEKAEDLAVWADSYGVSRSSAVVETASGILAKRLKKERADGWLEGRVFENELGALDHGTQVGAPEALDLNNPHRDRESPVETEEGPDWRGQDRRRG